VHEFWFVTLRSKVQNPCIKTSPLDAILEGTNYVYMLIDWSFKTILILFYHIHKYLSDCLLSKMLYFFTTWSTSIIYRGHHVVSGLNSLMKYMVIKRRTDQASRMGEKCIQSVCVETLMKRIIWRTQTDIKVDLRDSWLESVDWIYLDSGQRNVAGCCNTIKNLWIP
jgi:hypothetical protein